jgi:hypothetical protein
MTSSNPVIFPFTWRAARVAAAIGAAVLVLAGACGFWHTGGSSSIHAAIGYVMAAWCLFTANLAVAIDHVVYTRLAQIIWGMFAAVGLSFLAAFETAGH